MYFTHPKTAKPPEANSPQLHVEMFDVLLARLPSTRQYRILVILIWIKYLTTYLRSVICPPSTMKLRYQQVIFKLFPLHSKTELSYLRQAEPVSGRIHTYCRKNT